MRVIYERRIFMEKNYEKLGDEIITRLGGEQNITKLFHCATRLRFQLADMSKADLEGIKKLPDVMGVVESVGGVQVIIGNDVASAYAAIVAKHKIENSSDGKKVEKADAAPEKNGIVSKILNVLSAILGPAIPLIMCSGLISALLIILTKCGLSTEGTTYTIISMVGNAALYFLPVLLAYTSAKKFGCDIMTSVFLGAIMISPTLIGLTEQGSFASLFGLPVKTVNYSSTVIPIILTIWIFSYVEKLVVKIVPAAVKFVFKPLLSVIIMIPVMLCITGPIGSYCGDLLCKALTAINNVAPWSSVLIVGCLAPLLVLTGMHLALIPLVMSMFATAGYDNMLFVAFIGMNFSQFGVALACMLKTKNKNLRTLASSCAITAFLAGVTEPTLYGICVRMKKPLIATWIACIVNAIFSAIFSVRVYSFGAPSFFTMPIFLNPDGTMSNFYFAIAAAAITIVVSFVSTWVLGFDDSIYGEEVA
jgi:hypothetical protein